jgi:LysR family transcriptional regulator, glycine cleavage system transcriptional activator
MKHLPPLHFLPAFEAAGRLKSFKAAAAELHLTASAVSQQLRAIEEALGTVLFERKLRSVELTAAGTTYLQEIQQALTAISGASERVRAGSQQRELRLSLPDFVAYELVLPALKRFRARFPGVELRLDVTQRVLDFQTCEVDAAIRVADGPWSMLTVESLGAAEVALVCAPELVGSIHGVADLHAHTLIQQRGQERRGWSAFLSRNGQRAPRPEQVLTFDGYLETLRAAEQGLGVAFGVFPMASAWVSGGRLAVPLPLRIPFSDKIQFVYRNEDARGALHRAVGAFMREEYAALPALPSGRVTLQPAAS